MKRLVLLITLMIGMTAQARKSVDSDLDALGGNKDLMERANAIDPKNTTRIVQKRLVDRDTRLEIDLNYGIVAGGDPYVDSHNMGVNAEFHLTPRWSLGGRWYHSANSLSSEGKRLTSDAEARRQTDPDYPRPDINYQRNTWLGTISFYPFYGKLNLADLAITQFDVYFVGGYGSVSTDRGSAPTYTAGAGLAFWLSQHFSTRLEARYQGYKDKLADGSSRQMDLTVLSLGIGFLL